MIQCEKMQNGKLVRHYSDSEGMGLLQVDTGEKYYEAIDISATVHVYEEVPMGQPGA